MVSDQEVLTDDTASGFHQGLWLGAEGSPEAEPSASSGTSGETGLEKFRDLPVSFKVQIGQTTTTLKQWLDVGIGSRISLDESWRQPVHLFINDRRVGRGVIVLVGNRFGVRITEWGAGQD